MAENNNILVAGSAGMEAKGRVWDIQTGGYAVIYWYDISKLNSLVFGVISFSYDFKGRLLLPSLELLFSTYTQTFCLSFG